MTANARKRPKKATDPLTLDDPIAWIEDWFASKNWQSRSYQQESWQAYLRGESGLIHVPTGAGKTYAAYFGPLVDSLMHPADGVQILYITPLRAVSRDIETALLRPVEDLQLPLSVESRTGDTRSAIRARQRKRLPNVLVTTPESLCLLLTREDAAEKFQALRAIIVDEWHELMSSKRGTLIELALCHLKPLAPNLRIWGLSATLANLDEAAQTLVGLDRTPTIIRGSIERPVVIETLIPDALDSFPWAGHLGLKMLEPVLSHIDITHSTLIFTNTRSQAERWYQRYYGCPPRLGWAGDPSSWVIRQKNTCLGGGRFKRRSCQSGHLYIFTGFRG